jgi:hypothetical protein
MKKGVRLNQKKRDRKNEAWKRRENGGGEEKETENEEK